MHLICKECPNGCALRLERRDAATVLVRGNRCARGVAYAYAEKKAEWPGQFLPAEQPARHSRDELAPVLAAWGLQLDRVEPNVFIQGSPDRSAFRAVVIDAQGRRYVLETLAPYVCDRRKRIAERLRSLRERGLPVIPYAPGADGETVQCVAGKHWQLSDFVEGETLDRATYWLEAWRGAALADFLADLYANTRDEAWSGGQAFSLPGYIDRLLQTVSAHRPQLLGELGEVVALLKRELLPVYDSVPQRFCHGDPHPMNVLWGADRIRAVIDWEFSGLRPRVYDAALVIGCVGAEARGALDGAFLGAFRERLREREAFAPEFDRLLPLFTVAQRFAWLSEWLRRDDVEMIDFECFYMNLLRQKCEAAGLSRL
jgi:homoserine kinase type II